MILRDYVRLLQAPRHDKGAGASSGRSGGRSNDESEVIGVSLLNRDPRRRRSESMFINHIA